MQEVALNLRGMVPATADRVQTIKLRKPKPKPASKPKPESKPEAKPQRGESRP